MSDEDAERPLPLPDSDELAALFPSETHQHIYRLLYERRLGDGPTTKDVHAYVAEREGEAQDEADRRMRQLRRQFVVARRRVNGAWRYYLEGWKPEHLRRGELNISGKLKAKVLAPQICAMCGKRPIPHGVELVVDHKVPQAWGGTDEEENLQPLCVECNGNKQDHFATFDDYSDKIAQAANEDEAHKRIGELLKAFEGNYAPGSVIQVVASAKEYQEDWQKRTRDLRYLGWDISWRKKKSPSGRFLVDYRATHWEPWPDEPVARVVRRIEQERAAAKKHGRSEDG